MHGLQPPGVRSRKGKISQTASATGWRWSPHRKAGAFKKALAAEDVLEAALVLIEKMVEEIDKLKVGKGETGHP